MNTKSTRILVAGATGYLGSHIIEALLTKKSDFKALARTSSKLKKMGLTDSQIVQAQVTDPATLTGCCEGIDVVISCVGITQQKDGLSYMDVDFQANLNLLEEAERAGVKKFIYISAFNAHKFKHARILHAKEHFAKKLLASKVLAPCIIRPNGFFSDIEAFYSMAKSGKVFLFGSGDVRLNPIHGIDLAQFCLQMIDKDITEIGVGGPDVLSANEIAHLAFKAQNIAIKMVYLPDWVRKILLKIASCLPENLGGPPEFFLTAIAQDMIAPTYGQQNLSSYFQAMYLEENKH